MSEIVVLTDGECDFCEATLVWMQRKLIVNAIAFQRANLQSHGLSYEECSQALHVVHESQVYVGADAIAFLLFKRGNTFISRFISATGPLGRWGYKWVAGHRNTIFIKVITKVLQRINQRKR